jgi:hypothetical protein
VYINLPSITPSRGEDHPPPYAFAFVSLACAKNKSLRTSAKKIREKQEKWPGVLDYFRDLYWHMLCPWFFLKAIRAFLETRGGREMTADTYRQRSEEMLWFDEKGA